MNFRNGLLLSLAVTVASCTVSNAPSANSSGTGANEPASSEGLHPGAAVSTKRLTMVAAPVGSQTTLDAGPSTCNLPGQQFPRIETDARVTFHFTSRAAQSVQVSINNTAFDMVKGDNGQWTYTSAPQAPGYHNYWMIVDGAIMLDPETYDYIGYGHMCNGFEVPEPGVDFYTAKPVPHGDIRIRSYFSPIAKNWRHVYVYTPPGYDDSLTTRFPVLYLQHGSGEDERVWTEMGHANYILDNLIADGKAKPMILVMETSYNIGDGPTSGGGRGSAPGGGFGGGRGAGAPGGAPGGGGARGPGGGNNAYADYMTHDLIPMVDSTYRTLTDRDHRAMAGLSMGGGITASVTMANLDKFSYIGLFSGGAATTGGAFGGGRGGRGGRGGGPGGAAPAPAAPPATLPALNLTSIYNGQMADPAAFNQKVKVFFFSAGTLDLVSPTALENHQKQLLAAGITDSYCYISPGTAHEWQTWRRSLYTFAPLLFQN